MEYDSRPDTYLHMALVRGYLLSIAFELILRSDNHDLSKLQEPELAMFNEFTPKLRASTYGSEEYNQFLEQMGTALRHHYESNDHHPEHFENGIHDMDLIQLMEMLADWKAATLRHDDGDLGRSIQQNAERFGYDDQMSDLLLRTADNLGWL